LIDLKYNYVELNLRDFLWTPFPMMPCDQMKILNDIVKKGYCM